MNEEESYGRIAMNGEKKEKPFSAISKGESIKICKPAECKSVFENRR